MNFFEGQVIPIDKPYRWSSFKALARVRYLLTQRMQGRKIKVGHAGTLDPLATGVLLICTGRATKNIEQLQHGIKEYTATLRFGFTTPSYDLEHSIDGIYPSDHLTEEKVREVLRQFTGDIQQVPPVFSACKIDGDRAYDLARKGKEVTLRPKTVHVEAINIVECRLPILKIHVVCGKGTYIRSLAHDIGKALGSGAHLTALRRTRVGDYSIENCFTLETFEQWLETQEVELPEN